MQIKAFRRAASGGDDVGLRRELAGVRHKEGHPWIGAPCLEPHRVQQLFRNGQEFQRGRVVQQAFAQGVHRAVFQSEKEQQGRGDGRNRQNQA